jgi:hypothetical protein
MKKTLLLILIVLSPLFGQAQEMFYIQFEDNEVNRRSATEQVNLTKKQNGAAIIIGGLNNWDGGGNYINVFGTKFIIDSLDLNSDGTRRAVLRREDGENFFNHLTTINAKLIPVGKPIEETR